MQPWYSGFQLISGFIKVTRSARNSTPKAWPLNPWHCEYANRMASWHCYHSGKSLNQQHPVISISAQQPMNDDICQMCLAKKRGGRGPRRRRKEGRSEFGLQLGHLSNAVVLGFWCCCCCCCCYLCDCHPAPAAFCCICTEVRGWEVVGVFEPLSDFSHVQRLCPWFPLFPRPRRHGYLLCSCVLI